MDRNTQLELRLRGKSTTQSHRGAIYYVDLGVRDGMSLEDAVTEARAVEAGRVHAGLDQAALDAAAQAGFGNAAFEFSEEEGPEILEEFYPQGDAAIPTPADGVIVPAGGLRQRLEQRAVLAPVQSQT